MQRYRVPITAFFLVWAAFGPLLASAPALAAGGTPAPEAPFNPTVAEFDAALARLRTHDLELAAAAAKLKADLDELFPDGFGDLDDAYEGARVPTVPASRIAGFDVRLHELIERANRMIDERQLVKGDADAFQVAHNFMWVRITLLCKKGTPAELEAIARALSPLEARAARLEADVAAAGPGMPAARKRLLRDELGALNADGTSAWNRLHTVVLNVDDIGPPLIRQETEDGGRAPTVGFNGELAAAANPLQTRVAELARRLQELDARLNGAPRQGEAPSEALSARMKRMMKDPFDRRSGDAPGAADETPRRGAAGRLARYRPQKTLLEVPRVPPPGAAAAPAPRPPVYTGAPGRDAFPEETKAVDALRAAGATRTIGDPVGRARLVYKQNGETCEIAAQVEVLADEGRVAPDPQKLLAKEDELYAQAVALGYFTGSSADPDRRRHAGMPDQYIGNQLDRPVRKNFGASDAQLDEAVSTGRMVIVAADSGRLWNDAGFRGGGHVLVITGAEADARSGRILGYYVNDTAADEGGRFVAARQFLKAWREKGALLVEPL